jgi:hypothetical protein
VTFNPEAILQRKRELLVPGIEEVLVGDTVIDACLVSQLRDDGLDER